MHKGTDSRRAAGARNKGGRRRTMASMDRDAAALRLYCEGKTYRQIAEALGWKNQASGFDAVKRAIADRQRNEFAQIDHFTAAIARIEKGIAECQAIIDNPPLAVTATGKVAEDPATGNPVRDVGAVQRAITEQRHLNDQLILLQDLKPASKQRVTVVTEDVVDDEIRRLTQELADAAGSAPVPKEAE